MSFWSALLIIVSSPNVLGDALIGLAALIATFSIGSQLWRYLDTASKTHDFKDFFTQISKVVAAGVYLLVLLMILLLCCCHGLW